MIKKNDTQVHHYLKVMETGADHPDAELLKDLHEGQLDKQDEGVRRYLAKRFQSIRGRRVIGSSL